MTAGQAAGELIVGMGEIKIAKGSGRIGCVGLGSCVAVLLYHAPTRMAAVAHVMLPDEPKCPEVVETGKYAVTAVKLLLHKFELLGIRAGELVGALVGGADLLRTASTSPSMKIGERNVQTVALALEGKSVPIVYQDVGSTRGRSFYFDVENAQLESRSAGDKAKEALLAVVPSGSAEAA